jgi:hypothetical protein
MNALTIPKLPNGLIPLLSKSLDSRELSQHQATVGFELEVLAKQVDRFGWDRGRGTASHDRVMMDWITALQDYPLGEVQAACRASIEANPNKMPNYGHVKAQIIKARAVFLANQPKQREASKTPHKGDPDGASRTFAAVGYKPNRFGHKL